MTLRATTHEQFRLVLRWVKEHPVLARADNEVEKGGRELKNKLWEKLAIELNEIGPPVRTWMGWKRVLTDYKYSLKKKIQRRIANTSQGGTEILASLSELETEALQASLLDWDFSDPEKMQLSDTPPVDDLHMQQKSPDDVLAGTMDTTPQRNDSLGGSQSVNGIIENIDKANPEFMNGSYSTLSLLTNSADQEIKVEISDSAVDPNGLNGNAHNMSRGHSPQSIKMEPGENLTHCQPINAEDLTMNGEPRTRSVDFNVLSQDSQQITAQAQQMVASPGALPLSTPMFANPSDAAPILQSLFMPGSTPEIKTEYSEAMDAMQLPPTTHQQNASAQPAILSQQRQEQLQQLQGPGQHQQLAVAAQQPQQHPDSQQPLTSDVMNSLIAREIDRMALAHKTRKTSQRKQSRVAKPRAAKETTIQQDQKLQKEQVQKVATSDQADRNKRAAPKRPRPRPKDVKVVKKHMTGREFRECLLRLLTEANEMEKRRIAITETKVRNQTEIQNLEITRMNLEIMKLQKEITLLDHGAKILP